MDGIWRECGDADGDVLGPFRQRTAVSHPFPGFHDDCLPGNDIELSISQFDVQAPSEDDRVSVCVTQQVRDKRDSFALDYLSVLYFSRTIPCVLLGT